MKASKTLLKVLFVVFAALFYTLAILFISSFVFMRIFNLPLDACRPWTIIQYFMMYRHAPDKAPDRWHQCRPAVRQGCC